MRDYKRSRERVELAESVPVVDHITNKEIGELVNITVDGMMIISNEPIATQSIFQLSLKLPKEIDGRKEIDLGVDCLWCSEVENFHRYWAGFQIIDIAEDVKATINALIENFEKRD